MIVVNMVGGLGNQMFEYALGRTLALQNDSDLSLDLHGYGENKLRAFRLDKYNCQFKIADKKLLDKYKRFNLPWPLEQRIRKFPWYYDLTTPKGVVKEKVEFDFDPRVNKIKGEVYLDGYWQCPQYFEKNREVLLKEFKPNSEIGEKNKEIVRRMKQINSVALSIRRGDYVTNPVVHQQFGAMTVEYYQNCQEVLKDKLGEVEYFVFGDDLDWAKDKLMFNGNVNWMDHNDQDGDILDMYLVSQTKNQIIANSTYSWWGAWLCEYENQIVCAPKHWFNFMPVPGKMLPEKWLKI